MTLDFANEPKINLPVKVDFIKKKIKLQDKDDESLKEFYAVDAVETAQLTFAVLQSDASYIEINGKSYVQAKLKAVDDDDPTSKGHGFAKSKLVLYNVSFKLKEKNDKKQKGKKFRVKEPSERIFIRFSL